MTTVRDRRGGFAWVGNREMLALRFHFEGHRRANAILLYVNLCELANDSRSEAFKATRVDLADLSGLSERTVFDTARDLEEIGLVEIQSERTGNVYTLLEAEERQPLPDDAATVAGPSGNQCRTPSHVYEARSEEGEETASVESGDPTATLPGLEPAAPPPAPVAERKSSGKWSPSDDAVQKVWDHYVLRIKPARPNLSDSRKALIVKALRETCPEREGHDGPVRDEPQGVHTCARAIDGFLSWRQHRPGDMSMSSIFSTRPGGSSLGDQIDFWVQQVEDKSDLPAHVPSAHRERVIELAAQVLRMEREPDSPGVQERGEQAKQILAERHGLAVIGDGDGKIRSWDTVTP